MVQEPAATARVGRKPAVALDALMAAAAELADDSGLESVSFRALGEKLGVSPMAVHRATGGIDALRHALVADLVEEAIASIRWTDDWQGVIRTFAYGLRDLLLRHPLVLEAHRKASLDAPGADDVAHRVVTALQSAGLKPEQAAYGYAAVHDFVTGHVSIRLGRGELELLEVTPDRRDASVFAEYHDYDRRFQTGLTILIAGLGSLA